MGETAQLFAASTYCLLKSAQPGDALTMLERGKARLLNETLALRQIEVAGMKGDRRVRALVGELEALRAMEAEVRLPNVGPASRSTPTLEDRLRRTRSRLRALIAGIRVEQPDLIAPELELPGLLKLIPAQGAMVAPLITSQGSAALVLPAGTQSVT